MKPWAYKPSSNLARSIPDQLTVFPRERDMTCSILRGFWNPVLRLWLKLYLRLRVIGGKNLPRGRSYVLVANHSSHLDALCLLSALPVRSLNRVFAAAARDYFFCSFFKSLFSVVCVNALPFDREQHQRQGLEFCADVLAAADHVLIMFPEGGRSADGRLQPFKPGVGLLVAGTDRLVVPSYIKGSHEAWAKGRTFPRPGKVTVMIGQPLDFQDRKRDKESYRLVTREIERAVRELGERSAA